MGNAWSCDRCAATVTQTVVTFSDELVLKITEGIEPEPLTAEEAQKREYEDYEWFQKLHCIDESHSAIFGISKDGFDDIVHRLTKYLETKDDVSSTFQRVVDCYKNNKCESLECSQDVQYYIQELDEKRILIFLDRLKHLNENVQLKGKERIKQNCSA